MIALNGAMVPLLEELLDAKRVTAAHLPHSLATHGFLRGWARLAAGEPVASVARMEVAAAVAGARLGALDADHLQTLGLSGEEVSAILRRSFDEVAAPLESELATHLRAALAPGAAAPTEVPAFAQQLARQPRAGVTCPGRPRALLLPAENHAEHCWAVAVMASLLAPVYGAEPTEAYWLGMVHHLHSAYMADAGFSGEIMLGDRLDAVIDSARGRALNELPTALQGPAAAAQRLIANDEAPAAKAFHAADVLDRVLEIRWHVSRGALTMTQVLNEYGLVHDGPVKSFHDEVLQQVGLL